MGDSETWRDQRESRYSLSREQGQEALAILDRNLPILRFQDGPKMTLISTLYFDTPDHHYLRKAQNPESGKSVKIRAREYLPLSDDDTRRVVAQSDHCFLERKERVGKIRQKFRIKIAKQELAPIVERVYDLDSDSVLRQELRKHAVVPAVISMYERRVWGSGTYDLRVTLDERIRYYRPSGRPYGDHHSMTPEALGAPQAVGPKRILEVKHNSSSPLPLWLETMLENLHEAAGFSKFLDGSQKLKSGSRRAPSLTKPIQSTE